jgi:UDP-galactopyranose mutase
MNRKILIVGCGLSGAVCARELAEKGYKIEIIDQRDHIGGNVYDFINEYGIRVHKYGPHLFHTRSKKVFDWLSKFTDWEPYQHRVKAQLSNGDLVTLPVNKETVEKVGSENVISTFIRPYSEKMWGMKLEDISPKIINRVPVREDLNELYFPDDEYQAVPADGYTKMVENILKHVNIKIILNTSFSKEMESDYDHVFNSMPIDQYYNFCFGKLKYRSIKFHHIHVPVPKIFPVVQVNFTNEGPYTRIIEWKNIPNHGINEYWTSLTYEEPCSFEDNNDERYYPVKDNSGTQNNLYQRYKSIENTKVTFIGRLGNYAYLNMDQCVNNALLISSKYDVNLSKKPV